MTEKTRSEPGPEEISPEDLDQVQGGGARAADPALRKTPQGKDGVLLFDEADSVIDRDGSKKIVVQAGDGSI